MAAADADADAAADAAAARVRADFLPVVINGALAFWWPLLVRAPVGAFCFAGRYWWGLACCC